ncbi:MAG: hypothetical protein WD768_05070 [Phycisphaeraceae bacterium]
MNTRDSISLALLALGTLVWGLLSLCVVMYEVHTFAVIDDYDGTFPTRTELVMKYRYVLPAVGWLLGQAAIVGFYSLRKSPRRWLLIACIFASLCALSLLLTCVEGARLGWHWTWKVRT